jgi:hypothetical protein
MNRQYDLMGWHAVAIGMNSKSIRLDRLAAQQKVKRRLSNLRGDIFCRE